MTAATREDISQWFDDGVYQGMRFMSVYCDTFDHTDYPVYTRDADEFWKRHDGYGLSEANMQRLMEVYDLTLDKEAQLGEFRAKHLPERPT